MDDLPSKSFLPVHVSFTTQYYAERRYATFKLHYNDNTPADYEPPHFRAADAERNKFFFATHNPQEVPETINVGKFNSGIHGWVHAHLEVAYKLNVTLQC